MRAQPPIDGMIAGLSATLVSLSTRPLNSEPMIDSWTKPSPGLQPALGVKLRHARRGAGAAGLRSIALSP